jgi:prepilin-type N-terminal cleavage/methylation domain-containing protein
MHTKKRIPWSSLAKNSKGFTLIEIIAVLVILSVLGAVTVPRVIALDIFATQKSFDWVISELNGRECITWSKIKTSDSNWLGDEQLFAEMDTDLGAEYTWSLRTDGGGTLHFKGQQAVLERTPSSFSNSATWRMR